MRINWKYWLCKLISPVQYELYGVADIYAGIQRFKTLSRDLEGRVNAFVTKCLNRVSVEWLRIEQATTPWQRIKACYQLSPWMQTSATWAHGVEKTLGHPQNTWMGQGSRSCWERLEMERAVAREFAWESARSLGTERMKLHGPGRISLLVSQFGSFNGDVAVYGATEWGSRHDGAVELTSLIKSLFGLKLYQSFSSMNTRSLTTS